MWFTASHELNLSGSKLYYKDTQILQILKNVTLKKKIQNSVRRKSSKSSYILPDFYALDTFREDVALSAANS